MNHLIKKQFVMLKHFGYKKKRVFERIHNNYNGYYWLRNFCDYLQRLHKIFNLNYKLHYTDILKLYQYTRDVSVRQVLENDADSDINL